MTEQTATFRQEGQPAFPTTDTGEQTPAGSQPENNQTDTTAATGGDKNKQPDNNNVPFDEHPRWKQREEEWNNRFNKIQADHASEIQKLREEFGPKKPAQDTTSQIPSWFGGDEKDWAEYQAFHNGEMTKAEERAYKRMVSEKEASDNKVKEATAYMQSEMTAIEADKTLNPTGDKIDPNKLLKIVMDNDLVDSQGRWNYRAGYAIYKSQAGKGAPSTTERKTVAAATTSESKPDGNKSSTFKTAADFKKERPW